MEDVLYSRPSVSLPSGSLEPKIPRRFTDLQRLIKAIVTSHSPLRTRKKSLLAALVASIARLEEKDKDRDVNRNLKSRKLNTG